MNEKSYDLRRCGTRLSNRFGDILRSLARTRKEYSGGRAFDRAELRVSLGKEVVRVHTRGEHTCERTCGFVGFYRCGKDYHVCVNMKLLAGKKI